MNRRQILLRGFSLLLGIGLLFRVIYEARFPSGGWTPTGEAGARLTMTWNWLRMPLNGDHLTEEEALLGVYRAAKEVTGSSDQAVVLSAEKVLYQKAFRDRIVLKFLMTIAYVRANSFWPFGDSYQRVLQKHGSAYEILVIPPDRAAEVHAFVWRIPERNIACGFPFMWAKRPELYQGTRPSRDVRGWQARLSDSEFTAYLQTSTNWFNGSRNLVEIDQLLVPTGDDATILSGLTMLRRHPDREEAFKRLAHLATFPKPQVSSRAIWELADFKSERAVEAIVKTSELDSVSRRDVLLALGQTGQSAAVKHLEQLLRAPVPQQTSSDSHRQFRLDIISALAKIPAPAARSLLSELATDKDSFVSAAAERELAKPPAR